MKFRYTILLVAFLAISTHSFAQYAKDAVRFSTAQTGTTSCLKAMGNATTAVGGDMSSISANPAGLGYFTHSEVSFTPEFDSYSNKTSYIGQPSAATRNTPNFNNAGVVFYNQLSKNAGTDRNRGWLSLNVGLGYNRTNNYYEKVQYGAKNSANSITDYYANLANSQGLTQGSLQDWASQSQLIDAYGTATHFQSNTFPGVQQAGFITRTGGESGYDISVGANYSNKLYLGMGVGIGEIRYHTNTSFGETGQLSVLENGSAVTRGFNSVYSQFQDTKGEGYNFKFGAMYKLIENVRVGGVITTPTFYTVDDSFNEGLTNKLSNGPNYSNGPVEYPLTYNMRTPFKFAGGLSVFLGNIGFITGDVERVDYTTTHISSNDTYTSDYDNGLIKANYRAITNYHAGAEIKVADTFFLRGGYGLQGNPLKGGADTKMITGGLGYRVGNYYVDAAYINVKGSQNVTQYDAGPATPAAAVSATNNNFFLTIGLRY
ncbi:OmpP1/FadL family transporter [Mucilaginibacter ximonensis]|uniref:OmpP1/FadL family transporter n=1 Tax=Mucilaginibacter ximonensis TaxID=538021 RepID=A0ABW5Y978_9SPHI